MDPIGSNRLNSTNWRGVGNERANNSLGSLQRHDCRRCRSPRKIAGRIVSGREIDHLPNEAEDRRAAALIAADPAFSALEASGAPVLAVCADPFRIVFYNAAAREIFSDDSTPRRLFERVWPESVGLDELDHACLKTGPADVGHRLERVALEIGGESRRVTVLCRQLDHASGARFYMLAALGLRAAEETAHASTDKSGSPLMSRIGASSPRFLWKSDAQDRFVSVDAVLADVIGTTAANLVGARVEQVARGLGDGEEWIRAIASRRSWSGVRVEWPLADGTGVAPVTLGALPTSDASGSFSGFNGYGLVHIAQIRASEPAGVDVPARRAANVVPLRPSLAVAPRAEPTTSPNTALTDQAKLTQSELSAFAEIARTLTTDDDSSPGVSDAPATDRDVEEAPQADASTGALATLLDHLPIGVLVARGAQTLFVNRSLLAELGYADRAAFAADGGMTRILMGRSSMGAATLSDDLDAHVETIDWAGAPATMISLMRTSSGRATPDRDELETKLARARSDNTMLRAVIESLDGAVAMIDESGRIESATTAFSALLGADKGAFDGQALFSIVPAAEAPELMSCLRRAEVDRPQRCSFTPRHKARPLEAVISRLPVGAGRICLRLRAPIASPALEHEAARQAAERANAAKSGFLARISHEIRTPLNAIIGFAEVMIDERFGPVGSPRYKDYLRDIHASGAHVLSLVNDLLDLSKIEAGKMALSFIAVDANAIIVECMSIMQQQANSKRVVMRQALASSLPTICADERALRQILLNLLSNAVKFTPAGGQVIVSTTLGESGQLLIRVKDTGVGMNEEEVRMALEPFIQIAPVSDTRGTGLGLPLTKALVEASRASLTIQSRRSEGTLVEVAFPLTEACAAE